LKKYLKNPQSLREAAATIAGLCGSELPEDAESPATKVVLDAMLMYLLERRDEERFAAAALFGSLARAYSVVTSDNFIDSFGLVAENLEELVIDIPLIHKNAAQLLSGCVCEKVLVLKDLESLLEPLVASGAAFKIVSFLLGSIFDTLGAERAKELYTNSGFNAKQFIKESDREQAWAALLANESAPWTAMLK
jgi:hypothetical protein